MLTALDRAIKFNPSLASSDRLLLWHNKDTVARLQDGPQCGLVAVAIAAGDQVEVDTVVNMAKDLGYTNLGEMFSVDNMASLCKKVLDTEAIVCDTRLLLQPSWIIEKFIDGWQLLVPYDCAPNHSPAMFGGNKAHWGLITGWVLITEKENDLSSVITKEVENRENMVIVTAVEDKSKLQSLLKLPSSKLMLVARQSKSLVLGVWDVQMLVDSNENLKSVEDKRGEEFVMPEGGVEAGLCGRMVLVKKNQ